MLATCVADVHKTRGNLMPPEVSARCLPQGIENCQILWRSWAVLRRAPASDARWASFTLFLAFVTACRLADPLKVGAAAEANEVEVNLMHSGETCSTESASAENPLFGASCTVFRHWPPDAI